MKSPATARVSQIQGTRQNMDSVIRKKRSSMFHSPWFATLDDEAFSKTLAEKDV